MKVIIDANIWISFCIGQMLDDLPWIVEHPIVELFTCLELNSEVVEVAARPRLKKYIREKRIKEVLELIENYASLVTIEAKKADFKDPKDNYLLDLCDTILAEYLITGDTLLLDLQEHKQTKIIRFREFCEILGI
jgi:uncharacterized protein